MRSTATAGSAAAAPYSVSEAGKKALLHAPKRVSAKRRRLENLALQVILLIVILCLWEYAADRWIPALYISKPSRIGQTMWQWLNDGTYLKNTWVTLEATVYGFAVGAIGGIAFGYLTGTWVRLGEVLDPLVTALYTLPRLALAPLFLLWFGLGMEFRVAFAATIVFFLVHYNTLYGIREVNAELIAAVKIMGASRYQLATRVIIPSALTWVAAGLKISVPYALVGVVVAEMLASNEGLGYLLARNADQFAAHGTFAAIVGVLMIAFLIDSLVSLVTRRALRWKKAGLSTV
ncbi:MAG: ABC transporter permease [Rhizobiaceae bacterium]|nr:ABC transporter permease [Rhizobiaceae bacterium]